MYIYHALINALSAHMIHINLNMIFYTHVKHSPTKTIYIKYYLKTTTTALQTRTLTRTRARAHTHTHTYTVAETDGWGGGGRYGGGGIILMMMWGFMSSDVGLTY